VAILQSLKENWEHYSEQLKILIFGEKNSRLDKILNSFYSMREAKRRKVRFVLIFVGYALVFLVFSLYIYGLIKTQVNLNNANQAYLKIEEFKTEFTTVQNEFLKVSSSLVSTNQVTSLISDIEKTAKAINIQIGSVSDSSPLLIALPPGSVIGEQFQKAKIDFQVKEISLKKLTDFLNEIHKLPNHFILTKLEITDASGSKLYFNTNITLEAYVPKKSSKG